MLLLSSGLVMFVNEIKILVYAHNQIYVLKITQIRLFTTEWMRLPQLHKSARSDS